MNKWFRIFLTASFALFTVECGRDNPVPDPGQQEEQQQENPKIKAAVEAMAAEAPDVCKSLNGIEVWQEGYKPSGAWLNGSKRTARHQMWSVTKTFASMAVGIAVEEGKLSLDEQVYDLLKDEADAALAGGKNQNLTAEQVANLKAVTVRDLLAMTCGHRKDPTTDYAKTYAFDLIPYISAAGVNVTAGLNKLGLTLPGLFFAYPFDEKPGTKFTYNSLGSHMLSEILKRKTGENLEDYLNTRIFKPLGMNDPIWDDVQGTSAGGWGLHLSTDEMVLFGRLLLSGGKWNGRALIPASYLQKAVTLQTSEKIVSEGYQAKGYGYQVWILPDGYMAEGLFGQYIIVLPARKAVIALSSDTPDFSFSDPFELLNRLFAVTGANNSAPVKLAWKHIIPAL